MKRFILSLTAAAVLSMPMAASALEKMDNNQLKSSTGQAGVSIAIDDVVIYQKVGMTTYWDSDGAGGLAGEVSYNTTGDVTSATEAGISVGGQETLMILDGILDDSTYGTAALGFTDEDGDVIQAGIASISQTSDSTPSHIDPTNGNNLTPEGVNTGDQTNYQTGISPLSIDVGTCAALTSGWEYNTGGNKEYTDAAGNLHEGDVAGVVIGLPTIEIKTYEKEPKIISLNKNSTSDQNEAGFMNAGKTFIEIETGESTMAILGGRLEIAPH